MEQTELDRIRQQFAEAVRRLLPGAPIERIEVLQHGDDPEVEPGSPASDPAHCSTRRTTRSEPQCPSSTNGPEVMTSCQIS